MCVGWFLSVRYGFLVCLSGYLSLLLYTHEKPVFFFSGTPICESYKYLFSVRIETTTHGEAKLIYSLLLRSGNADDHDHMSHVFKLSG